jgi:ankyrin repeat protein
MTTFADILKAVYRNEAAPLAAASARDLNQTDSDGRTPLMHAVLSSDANPAVVQTLLDRGADATASDADRHWTALHFAAQNKQAALIPLLVSSGADVNAVDRDGRTPLWVLADGVPDDPAARDSIEALLKAGADAGRADDQGTTPRDRLMQRRRPGLLAALDRHQSDHR